MVEPEVVATSPNRIKSLVPVFCGFDFLKIGTRGRTCTCTGDALDVVSLLLDYASRMKWSLQPGMLRRDFSTKEIRRLLRGGARS